MNLKKYNSQTLTWDIIASGNASGIVVTDPHFVDEGNVQKSVNDVLVEIDDKIEQTRRNLSWVVQNGTLGGGGGGSSTEATLSVTNAEITTIEGVNYLYATSQSVTLNYLITELRPNQKYFLNVTLDGSTIINNMIAYSSVTGRISIDNITQVSDRINHSIVITATNENGISLTPYMLTVVEASISVESSVSSITATIGLPYQIQYSVTNKVLGVATQLIVNNETNGTSKVVELGSFTSSAPITVNVNFFDLFDAGTTAQVGSSYTISAYATTTVDGQPIQSASVTDRVVVEDGQTLVVLVDGISEKDVDTDSITKFDQAGNISFTFTPYLAGVNVIYYAIRIQRGNIITDIGNFDADISNFDQNSYTQRGVAKVFSWIIPQEDAYLGDYQITLKCWSEKGEPVAIKELVCKVVASAQSLLQTLIPNQTMYAQWHIKLASFPQKESATQWSSYVSDFRYPGDLIDTPMTTNLNVFDTNGELSGFRTDNGQSRLRLVGESYGIIDVQPFVNDPDDAAMGIYNWGYRGFTFSLTFKTDKHPYNDRSVFFIGSYDTEGELSEGIWVGLEDVVWKYTDDNIKQTVSCKIQQNVVTSLDFVVDRTRGELKIFVNGVLNVAREITDKFRWHSDSKMYLAANNVNGEIGNFSDVDFYDIALFMAPLDDFQVVVNSMNSRARSLLLETGAVDFNQYNQWKQNNFFDTTSTTANSLLWQDGDYAPQYFNTLVTQKIHLPIAWINCNGTGFERSTYESISLDTNEYGPCTFNYYDPTTGKTVSTTDVYISKQGTSSTAYRSKNIEIMFRKMLANGKYELFRPKATWFPENQFTLKADVVDSAHANNAAIGKWINDNADILGLEKTPPMRELEYRKPINSGSDDRESNTIDDVTIKHTLEGFPIILLITFDKESTQEMLGIYSFNLGRASYYNMGMKFLRSFTHDISNADNTITMIDELPAFVTDYSEYSSTEKFGSIVQSQIYSYEFGENANIIETADGIQPTALFMQDDMSIIRHVGEFKFNGASAESPTAEVTDTAIWLRLQLLFSTLSQMTGSETDKYLWNDITKGYEKKGETYPALSDWGTLSAQLDSQLHINNAYIYFMICVVFGLVDSLGKNMVLRSWNVGGTLDDANYNKWWPCFYDMDTATGLSNTGEENVAKTAYIDGFTNTSTTTGVNSLIIKLNDPDGGYDTYSSRLWDVLRDNRFIATGTFADTYETIWDRWRINKDLIGGDPVNNVSGAQDFVDNYFSAQTEGCGELLYNYDYRVKYLTKYKKDESSVPTYGNVLFLHGTRSNYVKDWLSKRLTFMDGVFNYSNASVTLPYNDIGSFSCGGAQTGNSILTVKTNSPVIMTINIGNAAGGTTRYFVDENTETSLYLASLSSFNTQIAVNNVKEISLLKGLKDMRFQNFMDTMKLPSMSEIDLSNVTTLSSNPVDFSTVFTKFEDGDSVNRTSDVRHINLSNTQFWTGNTGTNDFPVAISNYKKLKTLDISNSCVKSVSLPNAALSELYIYNSAVESISLVDQPFIDEVDFTGCTKLQELVVTNCHKIKTLDLRNMSNLQKVTITGCSNLLTIVLSGCTKLTMFNITNAPSLTSVDLSGCSNTMLTISLLNVNSLTSLNLSNTNTANPISFTSGFNSLTHLNLYSSNICAFQFGTNPIANYNDDYVLDLSMFDFTYLNILANTSKYIKFRNNSDETFKVNASTFEDCVNLTRVFGHLELTANSTFNNCTNFTIHGMNDEDVPQEGLWNDGEYTTNIKVSSTSLASAFANTSCNLYDVYYILDKCDNVINLNSTFSQCKKVITTIDNPLRRSTFKHCGNVTSASSLFYATNVAGPLYSPTHNDDTIIQYNGLLSPLVNLVSAANMFNSYGTKYIDDLFFSPCAVDKYLKINSVSAFFRDSRGDTVEIVDNCNESLTSDNVSSHYTYARATKLLRYLPDITTISDAFNNMRIDFDLETYSSNNVSINFCPLIAYNTKLTTLSRAFHNIKAKGSLDYLFGGHEVFDDSGLFSRKITSINDFIVITSNESSKVTYKIHNSMFRLIKNTLQYIDRYGSQSITTSEVSLNGAGIDKLFLQEGDELFPLNVFTEVKNLIACPLFFYGMRVTTPTSNLELPGDMFINNTKLSNIYGCFYNMGSTVTYSLTSKGFINCQLKDVRYVFAGTSSNYSSKKGNIPYGLFYQEKSVYKDFSKGWNEQDATTAGIDENYGIKEDGSHDDIAVMPIAKNYSQYLKTLNKTITQMDYALAYFGDVDAKPYTRVLYDMNDIASAGDVITYNDSYDPRKYILNESYDPYEQIPNPDYDETVLDDTESTIPNPKYDPRRVIVNPAYDPYKYIWNEYYYDGVYGLNLLIENSNLYKTSNQISKVLPDEFLNEDDNKVPYTYANDRADSMNYICPPDLFLYCANQSVTLSHCIAYTSVHTVSQQDRLSRGIYGRIPRLLFKPLTKTTTIDGVFEGCHCITPYTWWTENYEGTGNMFYPNLFEYNKSLQNVNRLFVGIYIPSGIIIPSVLFALNVNLTNVSYLFYNAIFLGTTSESAQLVDTMFSNNSLITNVSYMLAGGTTPTTFGVNQGPKIISKNLFTANKHPRLSVLTGFLMYQGSTTGTVPEFWTWVNTSATNISNVFLGVRKSNITNSANIPTNWATGMIS